MFWGLRRRKAIIAVLSGGEELRGLEIVEQSGGLVSRGLVYTTLQSMVDRGIIVSRIVEVRMIRGREYNRRAYRLLVDERGEAG